MSDSERTPSVELDGPRLDEVKARSNWAVAQLRLLITAGCDYDPAARARVLAEPAAIKALDMAIAALAHGRSSETVEQATQALLDQLVSARLLCFNNDHYTARRDLQDAPRLVYALIEAVYKAARAESPALGGERSPQSEAMEQPVSTDVRLVKEYDRLLVAVAHVSGLSASAVHAELQGEFDRFAAAVRQAERSSEPSGLTTGTEAK